MINGVKEFFTRYIDFHGRTSRANYWWTVLALAIIYLIIDVLCGLLFSKPVVDANATVAEAVKALMLHPTTIIEGIWDLVIFIPGIAMTVRRLHDINKSGFWIFIDFVPIVGPIVLLIFTILPAVNEGNRFGK